VVGLLAAGDGRSSSALLRTDAFASSKIAPANLSSTHPAPQNKKGPADRPFLFGGEGGIRTHGPRKGTPVFKTGAFNRSATSPASTINELHELSKVNFMTRHAVIRFYLTCS
jgi:hypothetical protein